MKIHEYQAKEIFKKYGVPVPEGGVASDSSRAEEIARGLKSSKIVVKAQVHAGGRGKAGGIKIVSTPEEAREAAKSIIGMKLVTPQTGAEGKVVGKVLVEEALDIAGELYLGMVVDRSSNRPVMITSAKGGMEIEVVAKEDPSAVIKEKIDPSMGIQAFQARKISYKLGQKPEVFKELSAIVMKLYRVFIGNDASLVEINPLAITAQNKVIALDAKMNIDDSALYRHPEIAELRDLGEENPLEVEASKFNLNYIKLDGNIGCMVNGAGLAMATMDIIKLHGGEPANFLDVGGSASSEQVANAFRILLSDKNVKAVLVNIFGGIVRCDRVAKGVVDAAAQIGVKVPVVVRLEGTNVEEARDILKNAPFQFEVADNMKDAAGKVVKVAGLA